MFIDIKTPSPAPSIFLEKQEEASDHLNLIANIRVIPSLRKEMAVKAVANRGVSIALACRTFQISECCYR